MADNTIANQFTGLPMASLIGGPLQSVCDAELSLANTTKNFIETVAFEETKDGNNVKKTLRMVEFEYQRLERVYDNTDKKYKDKPIDMKLKVPFISIVKVPSLFVDSVDITFDMEVKSSEEEKSNDDTSASGTGEGDLNLGLFSIKATITGSVSSHKENTRKTDTSAKYHVEVHAVDQGMPEGLARVLDIINANIMPVSSDGEEVKIEGK
ncbi:DUF2589 domain-containing protein [Brachyspira hampsonii]|uniref:DUF2589 domain-containing protein n=1 Tax=Brachyspira hampsonii TaxID=1287055 RepID=A0AAC9TVZ3_9SPIR|nr:DUF2589 domain-containing protein [Brachyspira hampsonii]ASJ21872.1 hypothetical protein BHAMNSH16_09560 [Brachyspira hampsonii]ELV06066.1 hypothetical protein H263_06477 [Brachyspira hampsonii 30599]MBW5381044.1 DUF2589 domain-containing protein [Brachyspira hampsonii]MBW5410231.1 DUF2589 domain-containing protein [Brachyspira hampsonii]OEJ17250.1 hypothetical protein A9496_11630 [Brachyspira hampsonii]